jgi:hypothetical protein
MEYLPKARPTVCYVRNVSRIIDLEAMLDQLGDIPYLAHILQHGNAHWPLSGYDVLLQDYIDKLQYRAFP